MNITNRRDLLKLASGGLLLSPAPHLLGAASAAESWRMGVIADLHFGLAPDAMDRLQAFMGDVDQVKPNCILQLGDFNYGIGDARGCLREWEQFSGPRHHVLGNHDMDKTDKQHIMEAWQMPGRFYSFDHRGWHFVVLDRNHIRVGGDYTPYDRANFYVDGRLRGFADPPQLEWLAADLAGTELPTVVFCHQGLGMGDDTDPRTAGGLIEAVLSQANEANPAKVRACVCGHHHVDRYNYRDHVHYLWINSASYYWVGDKYGRMAPYTDPLYTFFTFHPDGVIEVEGRKSDWAKPTPKERGYPQASTLTAFIRQRRLEDLREAL